MTLPKLLLFLTLPLYILDLDRVRSLVWGVGFVSTVALFLLPVMF